MSLQQRPLLAAAHPSASDPEDYEKAEPLTPALQNGDVIPSNNKTTAYLEFFCELTRGFLKLYAFARVLLIFQCASEASRSQWADVRVQNFVLVGAGIDVFIRVLGYAVGAMSAPSNGNRRSRRQLWRDATVLVLLTVLTLGGHFGWSRLMEWATVERGWLMYPIVSFPGTYDGTRDRTCGYECPRRP